MRQASLALLTAMTINAGHAQTVKIVGTGTATCATFLSDILRKPESEREYFSWAQGYMSGILTRAPPGEDEDLDLASSVFPVRIQLDFFREYCTARPQQIMRMPRDAVHAAAGFATRQVKAGLRLQQGTRIQAPAVASFGRPESGVDPQWKGSP